MHPDSIFSIFGNNIYLYGICIAVGILACLFIFYFYTGKKKVPTEVQDFVFFVAIIAIAVGFLFAKLYQAVYDWIENGFKHFDFDNSGITVMGGLIGGGAAFLLAYFVGGKYYFKGKNKGLHLKEFGNIVGVAPSCISIAHAFGRIGCLFAGCCHGTFLGDEPVFGGLYMKGTIIENGVRLKHWGYYIPTQLYESLFLFLLFGVLTYLYFNRCKITMSIYLISYGIWRLIIEFFRADERGAIILGLAPSQWQSFVFIAGGIAIIAVLLIKRIPLWKPKEIEE